MSYLLKTYGSGSKIRSRSHAERSIIYSIRCSALGLDSYPSPGATEPNPRRLQRAKISAIVQDHVIHSLTSVKVELLFL